MSETSASRETDAAPVTGFRIAHMLVVLSPVLLFALVFLPVQMLARKLGFRTLSERLPILFHRLLLSRLGVTVRVEGKPAPGRPLLLCANHASWLDIPVLGSLMPLSFVSKNDVAGWPVVGTLARNQDTVFIDRTRRQAAGEAASAMADALAEGRALMLFPEGTSTDGRTVLPFKSTLIGAVQKALGEEAAASASVQPVAVSYLKRDGLPLTRGDRPDIAWFGDMYLLPHAIGITLGGPVEVVVDFLPPLEGENARDRKRAAQALEEAVRQCLALRISGRDTA